MSAALIRNKHAVITNTPNMRLLLVVNFFAIVIANPKISTPLGAIEGAILTTRLNKTIYAFRGIRYAQPPIGHLRFKVNTTKF